jgi:MoaA/NifB/PqqE/SkfB family radical SAM enzyme
MDELNKIYVEPTSRCNLTCVTCIRHAWDEPFGDMKWPVYQALISGLVDFPGPKTIAFAGLGEPLLHGRFPEMVRLAHERGLRTEMTSNAMLLTPSLATRLIDAGLDQFTVSIDGASNDTHGAIRTGAILEEIIDNVRGLYYRNGEKVTETPLRIGIEFVAMRSNIHELPKLRGIAERIKASFILVTNVLPYTAELQDEILYNMVPSTLESEGAPYVPLWILPHIDWSRETQGPLSDVMRQQPKLSFLDINLNERNNYCPFVQAGSAAVAWHGGVSPCPPLLHSYHCFIRGRQKEVRRCEYGHLPDQSLMAVWSTPEYKAFRDRVRQFDFSPCTDCGGCDLGESNEEDCFGNPFPVCGDCLWARGVLRCA